MKSGFLRDYQVRAVSEVCQAAKGGHRRITFCLPVGAGKTEVIAELCRIARHPLVIVPLLDLMRQARDRLELRLGEKCDIEQGAMRAEHIEGLRRRVIVGSRDSLLSRSRYRAKAYDRVSLVLVDECHVGITPQMEAMLLHYESQGATIVGCSATPYKGKGKGLPYFPRPQSVYTLRQALDDAYLVPPVCFTSESKAFDMTLVDEVSGEWDGRQLASILTAEHYAQEVKSLVLQTFRQQSSVVYAANVKQALLLADVFERVGTKVSVVYGSQNPEKRKANMQAFLSGESKIIINVGILGYGWDFPNLRNIYAAAPTRSLSRLEQRIGRGTRALPGVLHPEMNSGERRAAIAASDKPHFHYYDITGSIREHQLLSVYDVLDAKVRKNKARRERLAGSLSSEGTDVMEAIREADAAEMAELEAQAKELIERRKRLIVGVTFDHDSRDPFAEPESRKKRGWRMMYGPYRGERIEDLPSGYLKHVFETSRAKSGKGLVFRDAVKKELDRRHAQPK
jgi:superfamily II DNA or RNA helicase